MGNIISKIKIYFFQKNKTDYEYHKSYHRLEFFDINNVQESPIESITYHPLVTVVNNY
jgi:hypothetical protein